ncbi:OB-fold domain-containing protein [Halococcus dombrowskii]|uniref:OB-fold domain-containing protein n=1 Tax=Halococcus dombrowskii TaxID=179637 RepID=A0AAV3SEQ7_HALDO|nr:OB-fold domain-containing protein [Halococcus dombrowskii]UOO94605.1 OB-fold domain-containing protein [Halococcus dombrowskii]
MSLTHDDWTAALEDGDLLGVRCGDCGATYGTPFAVCNDCGSRDLETTELPEEGEVYTETTVQVPPTGFEGPYQVGTVQLDGARVTARLEGDVEIGDRVVFDGAIDESGEIAPVFRAE